MIFTVKVLQRGQKVVEKHVEATDMEQAVAIAKMACDASGEFGYLSTERFVTWDKSVLGETVTKKDRVGV